jgi:hypothetical protein
MEGRKLSIPLTGVGRLTRAPASVAAGKQVSGEIITFAAWQAKENGVPQRIVVRCDGNIINELSSTGDGGFPCAVVRVDYSIGGYSRSVLIDAVNKSALNLWCESVEVTPVWDDRRIERIGGYPDGNLPCLAQLLAGAVSAECDSGAADARWLDAIRVDSTTGGNGSATETSIHPVPHGARGFRFLNAVVSGAMFSVPDETIAVWWTADSPSLFPQGFVQANINGATDQSIVIAPPVAKYLLLVFPADTISTFDVPAFIEWDMAPNTLPGY